MGPTYLVILDHCSCGCATHTFQVLVTAGRKRDFFIGRQDLAAQLPGSITLLQGKFRQDINGKLGSHLTTCSAAHAVSHGQQHCIIRQIPYQETIFIL
jgi:hypothetical protein